MEEGEIDKTVSWQPLFFGSLLEFVTGKLLNLLVHPE